MKKTFYGLILIRHYFCTNINYKGLQRTANEYAKERRIYFCGVKSTDDWFLLILLVSTCLTPIFKVKFALLVFWMQVGCKPIL